MADGSKTEKPTAKKLRDERKKGNIFMSQDIIVLASVLGSYILLSRFLPYLYRVLTFMMAEWLEDVGHVGTLTELGMANVKGQFVYACVVGCLPMLIVSVALAVLATGIQTRFLVARDRIKPKLSNLSPIKGIKKLFSLKSLVSVGKNLLKMTILIVLVVGLLKDDLLIMARMMDMDIKVSMAYMFQLTGELVKRVLLAFLVIAFLDYLYERWDFGRNMKMSKQEIKEEFKQTEGNPEIKGRIRSLQRSRAMSRMMQAVPNADVIIRNPTHYAVALRYDLDHDRAPVLVAKGVDELALRIVAVGEENGVFVIENKPLARGLYASVKLNQEIPEEYYGLVAEVLVYMYRMKNLDVGRLGRNE